MPELEFPSSYLDIECRTTSKQPFELGQHGGINVGGARDYEPEIVIHDIWRVVHGTGTTEDGRLRLDK